MSKWYQFEFEENLLDEVKCYEFSILKQENKTDLKENLSNLLDEADNIQF